ncbi:hypothetical protein EU721_24805 [Escherichia coli]|nr:hypothetical protein [Escherichia coli]EEV6087581.1 hypothetical protein [Escherichia coli]EEV7368928.1 hypothetical protein [Escherichia coli]EEW0717472.1 hypothetical protein [Escherichia coli]EEY5796120.1 hypothetical protein [Escherichia coli]
MKILIVMLVVLLTCCGSVHHSFMDKAFVGTVDNKATIVLFDAGTRNGVKYYRPQFHSDCGRTYNPIYQVDNGSTMCLIRDTRITHLKLYNMYMVKVIPNANDSIYER